LKHRLKARDKDDAYCSMSVCSPGEGVRSFCAGQKALCGVSVLMRDKDESTSTILVTPLLPLVLLKVAVTAFITSRDVRIKTASFEALQCLSLTVTIIYFPSSRVVSRIIVPLRIKDVAGAKVGQEATHSN
jgi:hypothetical protein